MMAENNNRVQEISKTIIAEIEKAIIGKHEVIEMVMAAVLAGGHILLEDFPGLGKTLLANSFADAADLEFKRIQFTPDLLPSDITGGYIFNRATNEFELHKGPLFSNIVLADEINRASPKTQSALLEAMQEGQVTLEGNTMKLPDPFIVIATQNPIEYEGTFPLPEAQLDRFIIKLSMGYPSLEDEQEILKRRRERKHDYVNIDKVTNGKEILEMRQIVEEIHIDPDIEKYIISIVNKTRTHNNVAVGASPRGSLALLKLTRAYAALQGREYILPDDIKKYASPALVHRLILKADLWLKQNAADDIVSEIVRLVPVPVLSTN